MKTRQTIKRGFFLVILLLFSSQCSLQQPWESLSNENANNTGGSYESAIGGNIKKLDLTNQSIKLTLTDDQASDDVVLVLATHQTTSNTVSFSVGANIETSHLVKSEAQYLEANDVTDSFSEQLRDLEYEIDQNESVPENANQYLIKQLSTGSSKQFNIINSLNTGSYEQVQAELRYENEYVQAFVDERDEDAFTDEEIENLVEDFTDALIFEKDVFGDESDINGDGKFAVLFSHVVNELGANQGGIVTGFFYALDLFDAKKYPFSNEMEIIYTFVPDPEGDYGIPVSKSFALQSVLPGVLPHEFQHMISFNQHYFIHESNAEKGWLNEALSHLAEDIATRDQDDVITGYGMENPARVSGYLSDINNICFTCGTSLDQRGGSYLFIKYLYEQAELGYFEGAVDGLDFLSQIVQTGLNGDDNVENVVFGENNTTGTFQDLISDFALTVYLSDSNQISDSHYNFFGIDLRGKLNDYRGTYLQGPSVIQVANFPYTGTLPQTGFVYLQVSKDMIAEANNQIRISLSQSGDGIVSGYLIHN